MKDALALAVHSLELSLARGPFSAHPRSPRCPRCGRDVSATALVELLYTCEPCTCPLADHEHLVEQVWHRWCYVQSVLRSAENE